MKLTLVVAGVACYLLGTRAGRQHREQLVALSRRVADNQTVQTAAGIVQAQASDLAQRLKESAGKRGGRGRKTVARR